MRVDFPKKSYVHVQKQKCGISNDVFFLRKQNCGNSSHSILCLTEELQVTVILCAKAELLNFEK